MNTSISKNVSSSNLDEIKVKLDAKAQPDTLSLPSTCRGNWTSDDNVQYLQGSNTCPHCGQKNKQPVYPALKWRGYLMFTEDYLKQLMDEYNF